MKNSAGLSFVVYAVLRLAAFLVPFGLMMLLPAFHDLWWLAAVFAALIGLSISVLFLRRPLGEVSQSLAARRAAAETSGAPRPRAQTERELEDQLEDEANERAMRGDQP
ncbi:DUF4229 domain-containing protein [Microbacterium sp. NPDC096154]|uniref:DUF4229 domain-containing protein n=1 Tax=Microbacterium sp. NPDC096154 TaxID=3155549 RepID=UPI0033192C11